VVPAEGGGHAVEYFIRLLPTHTVTLEPNM